MRETFLHFLWRTRRFDCNNLRSTESQVIEIQFVGEHNNHAGPDFFDARLRIGDTLWAGNVEIHINSSEWLAHGHNTNPAYDNVVLHVVLEEDIAIFRSNGSRIPCLELKNRIPSKLLENYQRIEQETFWIPCNAFFHKVPNIVLLNWLDRLLVERLELKTAIVAETLLSTNNHWEEAFYRLLARNFGLKVNAEPFEALARSLPLTLLAKYKSNPLQIEALLFGQAGFLPGPFKDNWPIELSREYRHLAHKHSLTPLPQSQWKFLRMRPSNFPTLRIAQFASLVHRSAHLFSNILEANSLRELENLFDLQPAEYWQDHYQFDRLSMKKHKMLGRGFIHLIIINTLVPFLFHYGKTKGLENYQKRAIALLEALPPESNTIVTTWDNLGATALNAFQAQALIQLKTRYCDTKRCLECNIGNWILK
ncbi:MAG: DUF2851 family protein [Saprospiraceae bacterium]